MYDRGNSREVADNMFGFRGVSHVSGLAEPIFVLTQVV